MITRFDDYLVHQTAEPIAHPATGDRNAYDRYFFHGYTRSADLFFAVALGLYPNRRVMDAAVSVVRNGVQHSLRASRLAPLERGETRVGPIEVKVLEPMRTLAVRVRDNDAGIAASLAFYARTAPIEEPRFTVRTAEGRLAMDSTRLTQLGFWEGTLTVDGETLELDPSHTPGARDRSWGVRPVGEPEGGAPSTMLPQYFWLWAPVHFDDVCTHFDVNEDGDGRRWHAAGMVAQTGAFDEGTVEPMASVAHAVTWEPGTRRARAATITLRPHRGDPLVVQLEPVLTFQMRGLGYLDPEWGHGMWKGPEALDVSRLTLADVDPLLPPNLHVQQLCRARCGARTGLGVLEQLVIGPHAPSGFTGLLDPAR
jgi:hypothetical protein